MSRLIEIARLIRIENCLLAAIGVWVGAYMTWLRPVYYAPALASLTAFLICGAGNIVNDLVDTDIDRISHPKRVLVREAVSRRLALVLSIVLNVVSILLALTVSFRVTILALTVILLLYLYNYRLKKVVLAGNIVIALLAALTFMTGGVAVDWVMATGLPGPLIAAVFAFLFHLVREIVKDVQDIEGDRQAGVTTLPQVIGIPRSLLAALLLFFALTVLTYIPALTGWFGEAYKIITVYVIDLPLLAFLIFLWGNPSPLMLKIGSLWLKAGMAMGIIALLLA